MKTVNHKINRCNWLLPFAFYLLPLAFITGCKKFVEVQPGASVLKTATVLSDNYSANSAMLNIYTNMVAENISFNMAENMGVYADELTDYDNADQIEIELYTNSLRAVNSPGPWANAYNSIYQANVFINGLQTTSGCSPAVKRQLSGEAYFVRGFQYFYLANIYGDVPLALTTDYNVTAKLHRTARMVVLQQAAADLQAASNLLNSNYVDATDTVTTTERTRPNKAAALAMLARAYLYLGDYSKNAAYYTKADSAATAVIVSYNLPVLPAMNTVFLKNSSEAIWQLQTSPTGYTETGDGYGFILTGAPQPNTYSAHTAISQQLMAAFETNDQRKTAWVGSVTAGTNTYYFPYKYKQQYYAGLEYTMVLRLGEQYLIRAEARAHEGDISGAQQDLNTIRQRAGLSNTTAATGPDLLAAILRERQVELFTEWGARWFDLCRTGNVNAVMGAPGNVCQAKGGTWSSTGYQLLFPLPQTDMAADPNLTQNPGY